jgi:hypothetical protein
MAGATATAATTHHQPGAELELQPPLIQKPTTAATPMVSHSKISRSTALCFTRSTGTIALQESVAAEDDRLRQRALA